MIRDLSKGFHDMGDFVFETDRLAMRKWKVRDSMVFAEMNRDPEVMRYLPAILDRHESDAFARRIEDHIEEKGWGLWAVEIRSLGEFIGYIGFNYACFKSFFTPCIEIGWRLHRDYWGNGFATEGAEGCLKFGFGSLGFLDVYSFTSHANLASERIMQKTGMKKLTDFLHPNIDKANKLCRHVLYRITLDEYLKRGLTENEIVLHKGPA